jgi:hypothetical protein
MCENMANECVRAANANAPGQGEGMKRRKGLSVHEQVLHFA